MNLERSTKDILGELAHGIDGEFLPKDREVELLRVLEERGVANTGEELDELRRSWSES